MENVEHGVNALVFKGLMYLGCPDCVMDSVIMLLGPKVYGACFENVSYQEIFGRIDSVMSAVYSV